MGQGTILQLSSGSGPAECELAVAKLLKSLCAEFSGVRVINKISGRNPGCYRSVQIECATDISFLDGSVQWICQSPYRPASRRKNWFVDVSVCVGADELDFDESMIRFETFRSSGKGGQHVNKTESGIRAIYEPTGDSTVSTNERSQHQNKRIAIERLRAQVLDRNRQGQNSAKNQNWLENYKIERGNPVRIYEGMEFKLKKKHVCLVED